MSQFVNFTSLPPEQEATFVVYEQQMEAAEKKGFTAGAIAAAVFFVIVVGIYFGVAPDTHDITQDMNMSNLTKRTAPPAEKPEAPAPK